MLAKAMLGICMALLTMASVALLGLGQTMPTQELRQIGIASNAKPEIVRSLIVLNAHGAILSW